jgi:hypothetical protein
MTRKTKIRLAAAGVVFALAAVCTFWLTGHSNPPADDSPSQAHTTPPPATPEPAAGPMDAQSLAAVREAYQKVLAEGGSPGTLELTQGPGRSGDGSVIPARFDAGPVGDLPPLPPELASRPELLPPPDESPAAAKGKESPPGDLPPLPPPLPVKKP